MDYKPSKTFVKGFWIFVYGGVGALASYVAQLPPDQAGIATVVIAAGLKMLENFLKHYKG